MDKHGSYRGASANRETFCTSTDEYVREQAYTQGIESFWPMFKCTRRGTCYGFSPKYLNFYFTKFAGHHCDREADTLHVMGRTAAGLRGKRLRYRDLTAGNGLALETRS